MVELAQTASVLLELHIRRVGDGYVEASTTAEDFSKLQAPVQNLFIHDLAKRVADFGVNERYFRPQAVLFCAFGFAQELTLEPTQ